MGFTRIDTAHCRRATIIGSMIATAALICGGAAFAQGMDRWAAIEGQAAAALPKPQTSGRIAGAALACEARRWTLALELAGQAEPPAEGRAALTIDGRSFPADHKGAAGALTLAVPSDAIGPLKVGARLTVDLSGALEAAVGDAVFALRGSRVAITAAEERCTRRDMSAYTAVTFTPYSSYMNIVRELRAADIKAFRAATASEPTVTAAMAEFGDGRRLLFSRVCGSSWYFGLSGCNITGFAPEPGEEDAADGWRAVYDTENVLLHTDPASGVDGWPDLVTLPTRADGLDLVWRWNGTAYALHGPLPEDGDGAAPALRAGNE